MTYVGRIKCTSKYSYVHNCRLDTILAYLYFDNSLNPIWLLLTKKFNMYTICINNDLACLYMTNKQRKKLQSDLRHIRRLGLPADNSFLSYLHISSNKNKGLTNKSRS